MALEFEWDSTKAAANLRKHGVSFEDATSAFYDGLSVTVPDPDHSIHESRYLLMGMTLEGRLVVIAHTDRGRTIRIISARRANRRERATYEKI
jgi:uncharacterized DUF497 family protein